MPFVTLLIIAFVLFPFSIVVAFYFSVALRRSFEEWGEWDGWGGAVRWTALFVFEIVSAGLYAYLVYLAIIALNEGMGMRPPGI